MSREPSAPNTCAGSKKTSRRSFCAYFFGRDAGLGVDFGADFGFEVGVFVAVVVVIAATPRDVFVRASRTKPTTPPRARPITKPKRAKKPNVGQKPTEGLIGAAPVTNVDAMTPTTAPVNMNDHMRGARRMVTSSCAMLLFSQGGQGDQFREGRPSSRGTNSPTTNGRLPRLVTNGERHERRRVEFDDVRRGSPGVTEPLNNLNGSVGRNTDLDRLAGGDAGEFLQDKTHRCGCQVSVRRPVSNLSDSCSAPFKVDSRKWHDHHASSGEGRVLS